MATTDPFTVPILRDAFLILGAAGVIIPAFHRLKLSPVVGFILVGAAVGPYGLGAISADYPFLKPFTISEREPIEALAEIGVSLLLFTIGLELSFGRLRAMKNLVLGLGTAQLLLTAAMIGGVLYAVGLSPVSALALGLAMSLSSSAIVLNILASEHRLLTRVGRTAFAILIFQDLALAPILFLFNTLDPQQAGGWLEFAIRAGKGLAAVGAIFLFGRVLLRPLLRQAARTRGSELFVSTCLIIVIGASALTAIAGLSALIGALLAGLLIAETEYHRQVHVAVEPFQGLLLGVFLISVGMQLDLGLVAAKPLALLGGVLALLLIKGAAVALVLRATGRRWGETLHAASLMASSSETSMILITAALAAGLVPREDGNLALLLTASTLTLLPFLARAGHRAERVDGVPAAAAIAAEKAEAEDRPVIVLGYGRVGRLVASMLDRHEVPCVALDGDPDVVEHARRSGRRALVGDGRRIEMLEHLDCGEARALVVTMDAPAMAEHIVKEARARWPDLTIVARARDAAAAARLYRAGASDAVPETVESSLQLSEAVLVDIGCKAGPVIASIHEKRAELREEIRALLPPEAPEPALGRRRPRPVESGA